MFGALQGCFPDKIKGIQGESGKNPSHGPTTEAKERVRKEGKGEGMGVRACMRGEVT